jgi:hypothetical protein
MVLTATGYVPIEANAGGEGRSPAREANPVTGPQAAPAFKAYNPDQPRVPAGSPHGGEWTSEGGSASGDLTEPPDDRADLSPDSDQAYAEPVSDSGVISDATPDNTWQPGTQYAALEPDTPPDASNSAPNISVGISPSQTGSKGSADDQYASIVITRYDRTGDKLVDRTSDILFQTLIRDEDIVNRGKALLGKIGPTLYGTLVHAVFARDVRSQDIPGIGQTGVEQSFSLRDLVRYGSNGSVRTDIVMRDADGHVIAIWDVKTGNAKLTEARKQEIRDEVGVFSDVPIIELHICRGVTCDVSGID